VVTASLDGTSRLWDVSEGWIASMPRQVAVTRISFSSDSKYVITEGQDGIVHVSDARTGHSVSASAVGKAEAAGIPSTEGSPDDQWLESLGDAWPASLLSSSADGRTILLATATTVGVWDVTTRRRMALLDGHTGWVTSGAFGPDATRVATASTDQTVRVWPVDSGGSPVVLPQPDGVTTVTFPRGPAAVESTATIGNFVLTTSPSGIARVWDVNAGRIIMQLHGLGDVIAAFSPDGTRVATARANGAVETYACQTCGALEHLRRLAQARIITKACDGQ
jgi:WD40 repeat protein